MSLVFNVLEGEINVLLLPAGFQKHLPLVLAFIPIEEFCTPRQVAAYAEQRLSRQEASHHGETSRASRSCCTFSNQ